MKALVVGLGRMGSFHAQVLADLGLDVTTLDPDPTTGADFDDISRVGWYDVAAIATPIAQLSAAALRVAINVHPKFLLVEKPFAPTLLEAIALKWALEGEMAPWHGKVAVGYVERFNPGVRKLAKTVDAVRKSSFRVITRAHFTRHNVRPSEDVELDLRAHDLDLARVLGVAGIATYNTKAPIIEQLGKAVERAIEIAVEPMGGGRPAVHSIDLTAHATSPLHAQWHAFLSGKEGHATPADAIAVLEALNR